MAEDKPDRKYGRKPVDPVDDSRSFSRAIMQQYWCLVEYRIFSEVNNIHYIRAFEGGANDCALVVDDTSLTGTLADRIFRLQRPENYNVKLVAMEIKSMSHGADNAGNVTWKVHFSKRQADVCEAVIITACEEPDLVALVPMTYVRARMNRKKTLEINDLCRPLWTLHCLSPFPPSMAPFMVPLARLGRALETMRAYARGITSNW